ncbi:hypothetical protein BGX21_003157 [Mortierella sp. AD011]|nr:hypothetical protein BGX20_003116 [Mortierella sp. AD010]KAF9377591.1 hypothetical protein BGX21_003157 [Mortierella sp. AD011]
MMNLKTTALLGNLTRQNVSRQLLPLSNSKNQVITLSQRTAQPSANTPSNPVRSFSSSQANRENNNNANATVHHTQQHFYTSHHLTPNHRLQSPIATNLTFHNQQSRHNHQSNGRGPEDASTAKSKPKHSELCKNVLEAINGQDARAVFPFLQEMRHQGFYADSALSSRIVTHFLNMDSPQDAEKALAMLCDCFFNYNHGRGMPPLQKQTYTSLAKDIANYSSDFSQTLSLARLMDRHDLLASSGLSDGTLKTYRHIKSTLGLEHMKGMLSDLDVETLLAMQASLTKSIARYRQLIEILLDAKDMHLVPSREICSRISLSFVELNDYSGQLAWDTAVQEIHPGFKPSAPQDMQAEPQRRQYKNQNQKQHHQSQQNRSSNVNRRDNGRANPDPRAQIALRSGDPSEAIIRACRFGYAAVALDEISKMLNKNLLPSPQAIADTIQVCAKREKERTTNYQDLYDLAMRSLDAIQDKTHRRAAEYEVYNAMLVANATLGDMNSAKKNYDDIVNLGQFPDATGYATLLIATTTGAVDEAHDALRILEEVKRHNIKPNIFFYNVVIGKLSRGRKIERVLEVYEDMMMNNIRPNAITYGSLISACTRVGSEDMARNLFREMTSSPNYHPRQGPHNAMIQFYVRQKKDRDAALEYYNDMLQRKLPPTEHTYTLLIEAFACIAPFDMTEANRLVQSLKHGPVRASEAHYGALIHAYGVEHRDPSTAEVVFNNMLEAGITPKGPAYQSLIESYITNGNVRRAVKLRDELLASGHASSAYIENSLIRGYGQERKVAAAEKVFNKMTDPHEPKLPGAIVKEPSTYQSMVSVYLENKKLDKAYATLEMMREQRYPELVIKPVEEAIQAAAMGMSFNMTYYMDKNDTLQFTNA